MAFFGSFVAFYLTPAKDFGLAAGWNKVGVFMGWQAAAALLALLCAILSRPLQRGTGLRRAGLVPLAVLAAMGLALAALIWWSGLDRTPSDAAAPPPKPTAPVAEPAAPATDG